MRFALDGLLDICGCILADAVKERIQIDSFAFAAKDT
jgi:hypothetical protein